MIFNILFLILGFTILVKSANVFITGASELALHFKIPKIVMGLTIVAFGTSAPELAVSVQSIISNSSGLVLGNVIGSNIMNILLILGIVTLIKPISVKDNLIKKEIPMCILLTVLLSVLCFDFNLQNGSVNNLSRVDAFVLLIFFLAFLYYLFSMKKKKKEHLKYPNISLILSFVYFFIGLILIIFSSNLIVDNAVKLAATLNISQRIISLSIISLGTTLPELITSISAAKRGESDMLLGNIIGSNIFNICIVLGLPVALFTTGIIFEFNYLDFLAFILSALILFVFARRKNTITKKHGILMILIFIIYYIFVII